MIMDQVSIDTTLAGGQGDICDVMTFTKMAIYSCGWVDVLPQRRVF